MTIKQLASIIAEKEGKKHQASIGDIREILSIINKVTSKKLNEIIADIPAPEKQSKTAAKKK